jgi:lysozyme family protein
MADFDRAIGVIFAHEGGYTVDHAGPTKYGVTLDTLRAWGQLEADADRDGDIDADDVLHMDGETAIKVYRDLWWNKYDYGAIKDQSIATKIMDMSINMGPRQAHVIAQTACGACGRRVKEDGIFGPETINALNALWPCTLLPAMRCGQAVYYLRLVSSNPGRFAQYCEGWLRRAYGS